jgi:hypothetical protein
LTGMGMFTLTELDGKTFVSTFMIRDLVWKQDSPNTLRDTGQSSGLQQNTRDRWNRFMNRLRNLSEGTYTGP